MKTEPPRKTAVILTIGSELLKGSTLNTNARFLGQRLLACGFRVREQMACDDVVAEIQNCLQRALQLADVVIVSGGLGPTPDDLTREAVAGFFETKLVIHPTQLRRIKALYKKLKRRMPTSVIREAQYPKTAFPLVNHCGIALGFCMSRADKHVVVLPGVPRELETLMDEQVLPRLNRLMRGTKAKFPLVIRTVGLSEPSVMEKLGNHFFDTPCEFGIYPHPGEVTLRIYTQTRAARTVLEKRALRSLGDFVYARGEVSLAETVGRHLETKNLRLGVAESCTGGQLSAELTAAAGASRFFTGGVVVYDNLLKEKLGVDVKSLRKYGAVSAQVAGMLARGAVRLTEADWGLSITGIAGPGGGSSAKPVGTVYIGLCGPKQFLITEKFRFWGSRDQIQRRSVAKALEMLWRALQSQPSRRPQICF